jgi:hypothetical protein
MDEWVKRKIFAQAKLKLALRPRCLDDTDMKAPRPNPAKILQHARGLGAPTMEDVRRRARELAQIDGWVEPTEDHWKQAKRELHGGHDFENGSNEHDMQLLVSEHDFISADPGRHTPKRTIDDDEHVAEELIAEGMDEALHEQMLEARRNGTEDSLEEEEDEEEEKPASGKKTPRS